MAIKDTRAKTGHIATTDEKQKRLKVKALKSGFLENKYRAVGEVFHVNESDFSDNWMEETKDEIDPASLKHAEEGEPERRVIEPAASANTPGNVGHGHGSDAAKAESEGKIKGSK